MKKCTLKIGSAVYAELIWEDGKKVSVKESEKAEKDGFLRSFYEDKMITYDPRTGEIKEANPNQDEYSLFLWCSQWVQERSRAGKSASVIAEGIDFSEILPEPESGVVY